MKSIGVLGGGQLARMLVLKGHEMGLTMRVLSAHRDDPAAQVTPLWQQGQTDSVRDLTAFFSLCDVVTFESEFLPTEIIAQVSKETGVRVSPGAVIMGQIQDRKTQKEILDQCSMRTSAWLTVDDADSARTAFAKLGPRLVFKMRRFGYDGYGTFVVKSEQDLKKLIHEAPWKKTPLIAEAFVKFSRELAISVARNQKGEVVFTPLVETFQENSRCLWVKGPVKHRGLSAFQQKVRKLVRQLHYVGLLTFELFDDGGPLWVNELAPRVHNSGHYSLDALDDDQFTLHLKAITNQSLKAPKLRAPGFAMWNLLGSSTRSPLWRLKGAVHLHWYGKAENRPGRKMGHINAVGSSPQAALNVVKKARREFVL